jgi:hypothetical protein
METTRIASLHEPLGRWRENAIRGRIERIGMDGSTDRMTAAETRMVMAGVLFTMLCCAATLLISA